MGFLDTIREKLNLGHDILNNRLIHAVILDQKFREFFAIIKCYNSGNIIFFELSFCFI